MAMERLQRMEEAIENYDRAIAADETLTLAYLYKGAVCNKLQRFREALDCYERAL
jgi:tetratricopeptide (TPR) repeat protein